MLYQMLGRVNDDRERRIKDKNDLLMKKIKRLERRKRTLNGDEEGQLSDEEQQLQEEYANYN